MKKLEDIIKEKSFWKEFLEYRLEGGHLSKIEEEKLFSYVENEDYLYDVEEFLAGKQFPLPTIKVINKINSQKKRMVFVFPENKNLFLKGISYYLMNYDWIFPPNLCSFRRELCAKTAVNKLRKVCGISEKYSYKTDVSDYFNSADIGILLPLLERTLEDNKLLYSFLADILQNPFAEKDGEIVKVKKGIIAGAPFSSFLANLYLEEIDRNFWEKGVVYIRYSDDIIVFADTQEEIESLKNEILEFLCKKGLSVNPKKEIFTKPGEQWEFLGFSYFNGIVDISKTALDKMKGKMKRKARALNRWREKKNASPQRAVQAFIRKFNKKFFSDDNGHNITWARWYFPVINTDKSIHELDLYMQDCIRFIAHGSYSKKRFDLRYETIKQWGYINLVNEYYSFKEG
ncbi:MAG: hypothetical protein IKU25_04905 [Clostridia bacterium]|nr:hypothetical protein [Clostridia bacterium]